MALPFQSSLFLSYPGVNFVPALGRKAMNPKADGLVSGVG